MITPVNIFALIVCYLIGSVPSAVWIGKYFYGIDVREFGSGNAGATNTFRILGKKAGIPVLLIDVFKGWLSVNLVYLISDSAPGSVSFVDLQLALGIAALIGHVFPVYVGFRGGKGIATLLGIVIAVHLQASLISIAVFLLVLFIFKYVSLASIIASFCFPFSVIIVCGTGVPSLVIFSLFISLLVLITHQKNIERLLNKQEAKAPLLKKNKVEFEHGNTTTQHS
jgi:glycerol-3-phosphate acyltransferase PlsY